MATLRQNIRRNRTLVDTLTYSMARFASSSVFVPIGINQVIGMPLRAMSLPTVNRCRGNVATQCIRLWRHRFKVIRINTITCAAQMVQMLIGWYRPNQQFIRKSVSWNHILGWVWSKLTISTNKMSLPVPAIVRVTMFDMFPKSYFRWRAFAHKLIVMPTVWQNKGVLS